jgi:transcriptional regulator with XRE-family HTH domain
VIPKIRAGRPERPIEEDSRFAEFARGLRDLRSSASLSVRDLAEITGYSASSISTAANGKILPGLPLTIAFARACGGDAAAWEQRWRELAAQHDLPGDTGASVLHPLQAEGAGTFPEETWRPDEADPAGDRRSRLSVSGYVKTASGQQIHIIEGHHLVFGRDPGAGLAIAAGRGLSRRAGVVTVMSAGAWIANISRTHALYIEGDEYRIRLPRIENASEPSYGWFLRAGAAFVGSRAMFDDEKALKITVIRTSASSSMPTAWKSGTGEESGKSGSAAEDTLQPFYLDPMTKLFLVALIWCRPRLLDAAWTRPLPRAPEIARGALEVTGAHHELQRFDSDQEFRDMLSARVAEHIKVLRRKLSDHALAGAHGRLSDETAVRILIEHGIITPKDLSRLDDPVWRSRQEDLWWTQG